MKRITTLLAVMAIIFGFSYTAHSAPLDCWNYGQGSISGGTTLTITAPGGSAVEYDGGCTIPFPIGSSGTVTFNTTFFTSTGVSLYAYGKLNIAQTTPSPGYTHTFTFTTNSNFLGSVPLMFYYAVSGASPRYGLTIAIVTNQPSITSAPITIAVRNTLYAYDVDATDLNTGDVLTYSLDVFPTGMTIDSNTGVIFWTPDSAQTGANNVTVRVTDNTDFFDTQSFVIGVDKPFITSAPITIAAKNTLYIYDVDATDLNTGDVLTYSLDVSPTGMTIDSNTGLIYWTPDSAQIGDNSVTVRVTANTGLFDTQSFVVSVNASEPPLTTTSAQHPFSGTDGDPINTYTGELFNQYSPDINLGGPMPLHFTRYYASGLLSSNISGSLGDNWIHNFEWTLANNGTDIEIRTDKGKTIDFSKTTSSRINSGMDDVEEGPGGSMYMDSSDIELVDDDYVGGSQTVGLIFRNIKVAQGATIKNASIQFTVDEVSTGGSTLTIYGEAVDNPADFQDISNNVFSRTTTSASVTWSPQDWNTVGWAGQKQVTPDISAIIQEIVDRPGWSSSSAINIIITGTGTRTAEAYDGVPDKAAVLSIETDNYVTSNTTPYQLETSGSDYIMYDPGTSRLYTFNSAGVLIKIEDGKGNVHTLNYDVNGLLVSVTDALGRTLNFSYDANDFLISVDAGTRTVGFAYTDNDLTRVTDVLSNITTYTYDSGGLMTSWTLPEGNTPFSQTYNARAQVDSQTDSDDNTTTFAYAAPETTMTNALGNTRVHSHTATGELNNSEDGTGQSVDIGSDATGRRNSITDRLGGVTSMSYHAPSGKLASKTNADGTTTSFTYTPRVSGGVTLHDLTGIAHADGTTESFTYDDVGNHASHTDQLGNITSFTTNGLGQILTISNAIGGVSTNGYSADGTQTSATDPAGNITLFSYDSFKRPSLITNADGSTRSMTHDNANHPLISVDENGNTLTLTYDANGNLSSRTDALGNNTTFVYDGNDRPLSTTDSLGGCPRMDTHLDIAY